MRAAGLTLIELLLVLCIIGLGWFTLVPRLDMSDPSKRDGLDQVNALLFQAGQEAIRSHARQKVSLNLGHAQMHWKDQKAALPAQVSRVEINGRQVSGTNPAFTVYPTGHMDELLLRLRGGKQLHSLPLARALSYGSP